MRPGVRIFLRILTLGFGFGAKHAKKPVVRDVLGELEQVTPDMIEDVVTPPASPRAKQQHKGVR